MILSEIRSLAKSLYFSMTGRADIDDLQWNQVIDSVNRTYWQEAVRGIGSLYAKDSVDKSVVAGVFDYSGSNLDAAGVHQILEVATKWTGEYYPLDYVILQDRYQFNAILGTDPLIPAAYSILGETIRLLPKSSGNSTIRITYVPIIGTFLSDSQNALDGKLIAFHHLIAYDAVIAMAPAVESVAIRNGIYPRLRQQWEEYLQSRQRNRGRMIRNVEHE